MADSCLVQILTFSKAGCSALAAAHHCPRKVSSVALHYGVLTYPVGSMFETISATVPVPLTCGLPMQTLEADKHQAASAAEAALAAAEARLKAAKAEAAEAAGEGTLPLHCHVCTMPEPLSGPIAPTKPCIYNGNLAAPPPVCQLSMLVDLLCILSCCFVVCACRERHGSPSIA